MSESMASGDVRLIGFGEAAMAFAGDAAGPEWRAFAFDIKTDDPQSRAAKQADYTRCQVRAAATLAEALDGGRLVLSLVTAGAALTVAEAAAACLVPGALYLDLNSVAPGTKQAAAAVIQTAGGRYVDVAVMAPVYPGRRATPLLLSGPDAGEAAEALVGLGFGKVSVMAGNIGTASSVKMIRSVMIKGMEALAAECALAATRAGVLEAVLASLGAGWDDDVAYRLERMTTHGLRRAEEMGEVAKTLQGLGISPLMASATQIWQQRLGAIGAEPGLDRAARLAALDGALGHGADGQKDAA